MNDHTRALEAGFIAMPVHAIGEVLVADPAGTLRIVTEFGELNARRAASCLLEPGAGDRVLVSGPSLDAAWVIAILERSGAAPSRISFVGDTELAVSQGSLSVKTDQSVHLDTDTLVMRAREGTAFIGRFDAVGEHWSAAIGCIKIVGSVLDTLMERVTQFARHSLRTIEGTDQLRTGIADYQARETMSLRGRQLLGTAEELVKIDGGQIHLG